MYPASGWCMNIAKTRHEIVKPDSLNASVLVPTAYASDSTRELTALLLKYRNPIAAIQLPRYINSQTNMQAASPSFEAARLFSILGVGIDALTGFAYVLIFISALSIFIALYNSLKERKYDLAIMRSMGASRSKLLWATQLEGVVLTFCGSVLGVTLGHVVLFLFTTLGSRKPDSRCECLCVLRGGVVLIGGQRGAGYCLFADSIVAGVSNRYTQSVGTRLIAGRIVELMLG
jgi:ABC-type antimicrobial peptide transport system permease subunit